MLAIDKDMNKNLKDINSPLPNLPLVKGEEQGGSLSYTKTHKLITGLYMVTDIIDKDEPIRNKLRTLGTEILSDIISFNSQKLQRIILCNIEEVMSFLDLSSSVNIISVMNCSILQKEFFELKTSIQESTQVKPVWLEEFLSSPDKGRNEEGFRPSLSSGNLPLSKGRGNTKGHTRIGVQKGSTLMQALSDKTNFMSDRNFGSINKNNPAPYQAEGFRLEFDILKKQRRINIISIIKIIGGNATIKDIKDKVQAIPEQAGILVSCSEKTLQRELMSMIKDGVLNKTGEKRWTRYSLLAS